MNRITYVGGTPAPSAKLETPSGTKKMTAGNWYDESELRICKRRARLKSAEIALHGDSLVIASPEHSEGHFCINQWLHPRGAVKVDAHFDWHLGSKQPSHDLAGNDVRIFLGDGDRVRYISRGRISTVETGKERGQLQVSFTLNDRDLADELSRCEPNGIDGSELKAMLRDKANDRISIARKLAASWMGRLPRVESRWSGRRIPRDVRRWLELWDRLATFTEYPFCCWPATWWRDDKDQIWYFQNELQNGHTFGFRKDGIWIHEWACGEDGSVQCSHDIAEFAIQFLIIGLIQGADGRFANVSKKPRWMTRLPLSTWPKFFGEDVEFVGGPGVIGTFSKRRGFDLACTADGFQRVESYVLRRSTGKSR